MSLVNPLFTFVTVTPFNIDVVAELPNNFPVKVILPAAVSPVSLLKNCVESKLSKVEALELDTNENQLNVPSPSDFNTCPLLPLPDTFSLAAFIALSAI